MIQQLKKLLLYFLVSALAFVGTVQTVQAALIATDQVAAGTSAEQARAKIAAQLARPDVQARLEQLGLGKADAQARVEALTDQEATLLAERIDSLPAGGDILGVIVLIFFVLLITDILGFTKVYPFTRPMR